MKKWLILMWCLLPFSATAELLHLDYFELDNGLQVAVAQNHKAPVVLQMLYYKTGSVNEPHGKGGIAHLLEHLMFRGTKSVPDTVFNRLMDEYGADNNAYTTYDETGYYEFSDISKLELMMALEADRMVDLDISEKAFLKERDIVLEERMQRFESNPVPLFYETMNKLMWQEHPMANPVSGSVAEIKALTLDDARAFYQKWYRPDNALLVLAGDVTADEARVLAEKYYGHIRANVQTLPKLEIAQPKDADISVVMKRKGIEQPRFVTYMRLEPNMLSHQDQAALGVLLEYLAGDDTSYLYEKLVYQDKKLLSADMGLSYDNKLGGTLAFYTIPADVNLSLDDIKNMAEAAIQEGLDKLTAEKVEKIKHQELSDTVYLQDNPESTARFIGGMLMSGYTVDEIMNYDKLLMKVTIDDIQNAWQKVLQSKVRVSGMLVKDDKGE